jgi:hypothetical protein
MTPSLASFCLTEVLAKYMSDRFQWYRSGAMGSGPTPPVTISLMLIVECEILASQASLAYNNKGCLVFMTSEIAPLTQPS